MFKPVTNSNFHLALYILAHDRLRDQNKEKSHNVVFHSEPYFNEAPRPRGWSQLMRLCMLSSSEQFAVPSDTFSAEEAADHAQDFKGKQEIGSFQVLQGAEVKLIQEIFVFKKLAMFRKGYKEPFKISQRL